MLPTGKSRKLSTSVPLRWGIGANRLCPRAASIPAPSFRGRGSALGTTNRVVRVAIGLSWYRGLAGGPQRAPVLFAHCGPPGAAPRRGRSRGRSGSFGPLLCGRSLCAPSPWALGPWPSPSPWFGPRLCGRWAAPGALGSRWGSSLLPLYRFCGPSRCCAPSGFCARCPPSVRPFCGGCAAADLFQGDVAFWHSQGVRQDRAEMAAGYFAASTPMRRHPPAFASEFPGSVPFQLRCLLRWFSLFYRTEPKIHP